MLSNKEADRTLSHLNNPLNRSLIGTNLPALQLVTCLIKRCNEIPSPKSAKRDLVLIIGK